MRYPSRREEERRRLRQIFRLKSQLAEVVARVIQSHQNHDDAANEIDRRDPLRIVDCLARYGRSEDLRLLKRSTLFLRFPEHEIARVLLAAEMRARALLSLHHILFLHPLRQRPLFSLGLRRT